MEVLEQRVAQKRAIHDRYCDALAGLPLQLPAEPGDVRSNRWLTAALLAPDCGVTPGQIIAALAEHNIEARHIWKPMHPAAGVSGLRLCQDGRSGLLPRMFLRAASVCRATRR